MVKYNNSPYLAVSSVYPEYQWLPWKFTQCPTGYWDDLNNQRQFMQWVGEQLSIINYSDWYQVTYRVNKMH
jgi:hypothetical protein